MIARFIHRGEMIDYTPSVTVRAGDVVVLNDLIGVANLDIPAGRLGALTIVGIFDFPKDVGYTFYQGRRIFWDAANGKVAHDDGGGIYPFLGKVVRLAVNTDTTVRVRLCPCAIYSSDTVDSSSSSQYVPPLSSSSSSVYVPPVSSSSSSSYSP